jgi:hypothetical protein
MAKVVRADALVKGDEIVFYGDSWTIIEVEPDKEWAQNALQWERRIRVTFMEPRTAKTKTCQLIPDQIFEVVNR